MNTYWNHLLTEYMNKDDMRRLFYFFPIERQISVHDHLGHFASHRRTGKPIRYYVKEPEQHLGFFTQREMDCMHHLIKGKTVRFTAEQLNLSTRTVEYYVNNMKRRFRCRTKAELIKLALKMDLWDNWDDED